MDNKDTRLPVYFFFNLTYFEYMADLSTEEKGEVMEGLWAFTQRYSGQEIEQTTKPSSSAVSICLKIMTEDIERSFKQYYAKSANGKKGGAPKGNQNARKSSQKEHIFDLGFNEDNCEVAYRLSLILREQAEENLNTYGTFTNPQLATLTACYCVLECEKIGDMLDVETYSLALCGCSPTKLCKTLQDMALRTEEQGKKFNNYRNIAKSFLKYPAEEIKDFYTQCEEFLSKQAKTSYL